MSDAPIKIELREITPGNTIQCVNARDMWRLIESKRSFSDWWLERSTKYGFVSGRDYFPDEIVVQVPHGTGKRSTRLKEYFLTLDVAKEFAMVEPNKKGMAVRKYFIECERILLAKGKRTPTVDMDDVVSKFLADPAALVASLRALISQETSS